MPSLLVWTNSLTRNMINAYRNKQVVKKSKHMHQSLIFDIQLAFYLMFSFGLISYIQFEKSSFDMVYVRASSSKYLNHFSRIKVSYLISYSNILLEITALLWTNKYALLSNWNILYFVCHCATRLFRKWSIIPNVSVCVCIYYYAHKV